ncbi:2-oxoglutarate-dependent dioxygenase 19-like isoform X2 [Aristolochia californica]|uniref:2-oxoglutarate-dependent dioxygenase 19-like isoform X2 n=1 Tax=Aristolochia californica TaxID=171875 RepID=UPI0035D84B1B
MVVWEGFSILSSMASTSPININIQPRPSSTIKHLTEAYSLIELPPNYAHPDSDDSLVSRADTSVLLPTIDFSLLTSGSPAQRSQVIRDLAYACREWGFFMVINHGVREELREGIMEATRRFFNLPEEEKREFSGNHVLDPIRCGTSFNTAVEKVLCWRDFLKILIGNFYPRCPQPQLAMGMPPHSDHGLLTVLIENNVGGLQVLHDGKWVQVQSIPNSFLVNIGDHLEILSNGRYKSVLHRAVVNSENTRISIAMAHGPSLETFVGPAPELVDDESHPAAYREMKYRDYLEFQQSNRLNGKTCLDLVRLSTVR